MKIRSQRATGLAQSQIRAMSERCRAMGGVNMGQGVCDTPPPPVLLDSVMPAIAAGHNSYTRFDGCRALRTALATKLGHYNGLDVDPERNIVVTVGTSAAYFATITALCDPGDRILMFEPYYGYHYGSAQLAGLVPDLVPMTPGFGIDLEALADKAAGARALVINSPGNPSGRVLSPEELIAIARLCTEHDLLCISDEIYEYFLFDGRRHVSMATLPGMWERTVTLGGYSKTFSITGWRIGYLVAPAELATPAGLVSDLHNACAPAPLQQAVAAAINALDDGFYRDLAADYQQKRDRFCAALAEAELPPHVPEGAYYVLADASRLAASSAQAAADALLQQVGIAAIPGSAFFDGGRGEHLLRFCFGKTDDDLTRACRQLREWAA